ncbi:fibronectin type III domain-containing protein [Cohnella silvisoli]|uniref:Fibronectin type III domain-containing protein n=1 Tax=Cohnella silvisoli TaxID=2873699 RepID=A0ABV1L1Z3_9BACL|nr:fibronectin type III domain-containing protein [Cohnella silvisoli]MCD9025943.1 fibronectin type III domain-containing protein [Cohnella silvisoli]
MKKAVSAVMVVCLTFVTCFSMLFLTNGGKAYAAETKIVLTPSMVTNESGLGDATMLVDEQTLAGDPANGTGGAPTTSWQAGWNSSLYPAYAYIDLGQSYNLTSIYLRDTHDMANITLYSGSPGNWTSLFTDPLTGWMTWNAHPVTVTTRYVRVALSATNVNMTEVIIYGTAAASGDTTAPAAIANLAAPSSTSSSVSLTWTAPGDDGSTGTAASYDIRYSTSAITSGNWASATQVTGEPAPAVAGTNQSMTVGGLAASTTYYFAMTASDEVPNVSNLSNLVSRATTAATSGKITLTPSMVVNESGLGDPTLLVDEQSIAGDPAAGTGGAPATNWQAGWNQSLYPAYAYIDLGQNYDLSSIYLRDVSDIANITVYSGNPGNWTALFTDPLTGWMTWNAHPVSVTTRFIRVALGATNTNMSEIVIYGTAVGGGDTTAPGMVSNLAVSSPTPTSLNLSWTAPGDDGTTGTAASYDIRYSTSAITPANWASAAQLSGEPSPAAAGTIQSMIVNGLSESTTYFFALKTSDEVPNLSALSNVASGTTTASSDTIAPAAVTNLTASSPTMNAVNLNWTAPGDDNATGTASSYDVRYSTSAITEANWASATQASGEPAPLAAGTSQTMTVTGLTANTTYYFALKSSDEKPNVSAISNVPNATTLVSGDTQAPAAIKTLKIVSWTGTSATLTWQSPGDDGNTGQATSYEVRYGERTIVDETTGNSDVNFNTWLSSTVYNQSLVPKTAGGIETLTVTGLKPGRLYSFNVKTKDEAGNTSTLSTSVDVMTNWDSAGYAAGMVTEWFSDPNLSSFQGRRTYDKFELQAWFLPFTSNQFGARVTGQVKPSFSQTYTFYTKTSSNTGVRLWVNQQLLIDTWNSPTATEQSATIALTANQLYEIRAEVKGPDTSAYIQSYWSSASQPKDFIRTPRLEALPDQTPPSAIGNLTATALDATSVQLSFTAPGDDDITLPGLSGPWGTVSAYEVRYSNVPINAGNWNQAIKADVYVLPQKAGNTQTLTVKGLYAGTSYYFAVKAKDEAGNLASLSNAASATTSGTADTAPPGAVTNLNASNAGLLTAQLTWTAPGDDGALGQAANYDVRFSTSPINAANWDNAVRAFGAPVPATAGTGQSMTVQGLRPGTMYYFALKTRDEADQPSPISNIVTATTTSAPGGYIVSGASTMDLIVSPQELGNVYYVVYNSAQTPPTAAALKAAAQGSTVGPLVKNGIVPVNQAGVELTRTIGKLPDNVTYYAYWVAEGQTSGLGTVYSSVNTLQIRQKEVQFNSSLAGVGGVHYLAYAPEDVYRGPNGKYPLLLFLHGGGEEGTDVNKLTIHGPPQLIKNGQEMPFIVISPQSKGTPTTRWYSPGYIDDFARDAMNRYPIDPERIYVTGLSIGGGGTYYYANEHPEKVAAIVPIASQIRNFENSNNIFITPDNAFRMNAIPSWAFINATDTVSGRDQTEKVFSYMINSPLPPVPSPLMTVYQKIAHDGWDETYNNPDVYTWLLNQTK